ncbi:hypothetical protein HNY73_014304 [Argiope bruennichi]|uniref:Uncharacterized protein n=1 Tax=Argiope bruennichi TaxID=94029 RepID=A0A8T0ENJ3_ARGBR|nr:hypothetical protein HNY73_014304 [Argiope bruennichi]
MILSSDTPKFQNNSKSVAEYIISNPDFLDDLVKSHISQDRVRAWIKQPTDDDIGITEAVDYEGNVEITAQEEAEEEEEEVYKSSSSKTKKKESSSKELEVKKSGDPISKKFSKRILQVLPTGEEDEKSEAKLKEKTTEDESPQESEKQKIQMLIQ